MEIFEKLPDEINHLVSEFSSTPVVGDLSCGITQYSFWLIVSTIVLLIVLAVFKKKQTLVPKGFFVNGFEYIIEYVENDIGKGVVGENWKKHFPFLCSLFLFILINNMIGLIPGMKPGTGAPMAETFSRMDSSSLMTSQMMTMLANRKSTGQFQPRLSAP